MTGPIALTYFSLLTHRNQSSKMFSIAKNNGLKIDLDFKYYSQADLWDWTRFHNNLMNYLYIHNLLGGDRDESCLQILAMALGGDALPEM